MKKILPLLSILLITACQRGNPDPALSGRGSGDMISVTLAGRELSARVADTAPEQIRGLAGTATLTDSEGMLFVFGPEASHSFWMKGMLIPIDILWLKDETVIGIEKNVPVPLPGTPDAALPHYNSPGPVTHVLEVSAGFADRYEIKAGSPVRIDR